MLVNFPGPTYMRLGRFFFKNRCNRHIFSLERNAYVSKMLMFTSAVGRRQRRRYFISSALKYRSCKRDFVPRRLQNWPDAYSRNPCHRWKSVSPPLSWPTCIFPGWRKLSQRSPKMTPNFYVVRSKNGRGETEISFWCNDNAKRVPVIKGWM